MNTSRRDQRSGEDNDSSSAKLRHRGNPTRQKQHCAGVADCTIRVATITTILMILIINSVGKVETQSLDTNQTNWRLIQRSEWHARTPREIVNFTGAAPYLIIHHSYRPGVCLTTDACKASMRSMQDFHMDDHNWPDIGYNFAVGGDGNVYEARGFNVVGAHAPHYNNCSIGLLLIGNFVEKLPPPPMLQVAESFIEYAILKGHLKQNYTLYGHRQVRDTQCPGDALYAVVQRWPHWRMVVPSSN